MSARTELQTLFVAFAKLCERKLAPGLPWKVVEVVPQVDGSLSVTFQAPQGPKLVLSWLEKESSQDGLLPGNAGNYLFHRGSETDESRLPRIALALRNAVDDAAMLCMQSQRFSLLHFTNRHTMQFSFTEDTLERAFASRLGGQDVSLAGFVGAGFGLASPNEYVVTLEDPLRGEKLRFSFTPAKEIRKEDTVLRCGPLQVTVEFVRRGCVVAQASHQNELSTFTGAVGMAVRGALFLTSRSFTPDAELRTSTEPSPEPSRRDEANEDGVYSRDEGSEGGEYDKWRTFVSINILEPDLNISLWFPESTVHILHGENECRRIHAVGAGRTPLHHPLFEPEFPAMDRDGISTNLTDADFVMGITPRLDALFKDVAEQADKPQLVTLVGSCAGQALGEDLEAVKRRYAACNHAPLLHTELTTVRTHEETVSRLLNNLAKLARDGTPHSGPHHGLTLFGYTPDRYLKELTDILQAIGIEVTGILLPRVSVADMHALLRADVVVANPFKLWRAGLAGLLDEKQTVLSPPMPYGIARSRTWLETIAGVFGLRDRLHDHLAERPDLEDTRTVMDGPHRVGIIGDAALWNLMTSDSGLFGIPIPAFLADLGFGIDVFLYRPDVGQAPPFVGSGNGGTNLHEFSDLATLAAVLLRHKESKLVFSGYPGDRRVTAFGKIGFFMNDLHPGFRGCVETLAGLEQRIRMTGPTRWGNFVKEEGWNHDA